MAQCVEALSNLLLGPNPQELARKAVRSNDDKTLATLLAAKGARRVRANEKDPTNNGYTLLSEAAEFGHNKCVKLLMEKARADPNIQNDAGFVPLTLALRNGHDGTATIIVNTAVELKMDINLESADITQGRTALLWACTGPSSKSGGSVASVIKLLVAQGADTEAKDRAGLTCLMHAADQNNADITRVLLQSGANPKTQDLKAGTALSRARDKHHTLVAQLIEQAIQSAHPTGAAAGAGGGGKDSKADSKGASGASPEKGKAGATAAKAGAKSRANPLAGKGALGSQVADTFATGGRASSLVADTKERTKNVQYKAISLDAALNQHGGR